MSPPYIGCFVYHVASSHMDCEERSDVAILVALFKAVARGIPDAPCAGTTDRV